MPRVGLRNSLRAFTLIELSIVLVVIGLLVGAVISGASIVRTSQARATLTQVIRYRTAMNLFKSQYEALPGDMSNASSYWSTTLNGNGNTLLSDTLAEPPAFWHHLSLAGLIPGNYSGTASANPPLTGIDNPTPAHNPNSNFIAWHFANTLYGKYAPVISVNSSKSGCGNSYWCGGARLSDAFYWDTKGDDGDPGRGMMVVLRGWDTPAGQCIDKAWSGSVLSLPVTYQFSTDNGGMNCWVFFYLQ